MAKAEQLLRELLESSGLQVNGPNPFDPQIHNKSFYSRVIGSGALGLGESYMDGWWDCDRLDEMLNKILRADIASRIKRNLRLQVHLLSTRLMNRQSRKRAFQVGEQHYDIGNDLYTRMLDKRMLYTCGYWKKAKNLDEAQEAKLDLVCRKIELQPGMHVLELGCGWGSFAKYAAEKYQAQVTALTVSKEQVELGRKMCAGLPVDIRLEDYRNVTGTYDRVISIGIMEHVGYKNYREYMQVADRTLKDDGIAFIHTIGGNTSVTSTNEFTDKYIFPNGMLPSIAQLGKAMEGLFVMEDWHNFGPDYDKTLLAWYDNFEKAWPELKEKYGERFYRMWRYYLLTSAGGFRARDTQLWQIVMTKPGRNQPACRIS